MATPQPDERREFDWVVDLDDPLQGVRADVTREEEPEAKAKAKAETEAAAERTAAWARRQRREFFRPVMLALLYGGMLSGARWWYGF